MSLLSIIFARSHVQLCLLGHMSGKIYIKWRMRLQLRPLPICYCVLCWRPYRFSDDREQFKVMFDAKVQERWSLDWRNRYVQEWRFLPKCKQFTHMSIAFGQTCIVHCKKYIYSPKVLNAHLPATLWIKHKYINFKQFTPMSIAYGQTHIAHCKQKHIFT